jgi:hypothetical protein
MLLVLQLLLTFSKSSKKMRRVYEHDKKTVVSLWLLCASSHSCRLLLPVFHLWQPEIKLLTLACVSLHAVKSLFDLPSNISLKMATWSDLPTEIHLQILEVLVLWSRQNTDIRDHFWGNWLLSHFCQIFAGSF